MGLRDLVGVLFCDGDGCDATVDVKLPVDGPPPCPEGWAHASIHTSIKVIPPAARAMVGQHIDAAEGAVPHAGLAAMRAMYENVLTANMQPFTWSADLCPTCQERPMSAHLSLAIARAEADSARPIGVPLPFVGFGVVVGGAPAPDGYPSDAAELDEAANTPPSQTARRFTLAPDQEDI